jgi:ribosomal protein S18 acetylase RimI-like enzyme
MKNTPPPDSPPVAPSKPPSSFVSSGGELHLSNLGQLELLRGLIERGLPLRTPVRGFSMRPFVRDGDVLTIAPLAGRSPEIGEVIAFVQPETGRLAIHRVVSRTPAGWILRGDNCSESDGLVPADHLLGRVVAVERNGRNVRFGLGAGRGMIGTLNRGRAWMLLKAVGRMTRWAAGFALRRIQSLSIYRSFGRRLAPRFETALADETALAVVHRHFNPDGPYRDRLPNPNVVNWVAKRGSEIVGFVQYVYHPESDPEWEGHWLFSLEVWRNYRGMGIGEMLTKRVIEQAAAQEAKDLWLVVYEDNDRAIRLYQKLGFEIMIHPALEPKLEAEKKLSGKRRIAMRKSLQVTP